MRRLLVALVVVLGMTLPQRVLFGTGAGTFTPSYPPFTASWTRSGSNPILSPAVAWEETAVYEPCVIYDGGWKMWYGGGWANGAIGYATSTDGVSWTKYAGNPVIGQGGSGVAGNVIRNEVVKVAPNLYYMYYADANPTGNIKIASSNDGIAWTVIGTAVANTAASWATGFQNSSVLRESATSWKMLVDGYNGTTFELALFTSTDGITWTIGNSGNQLTTLKVHAGGTYGSPDLHTFGGTYHVYYLAVNGTGNLPTNIYHASSTDLVTWTISPATPVLTLLGSGFEIDQVADPCVVQVGTSSYLYYAGMNNSASAGKIGLATYP